MQFEKFFGLVIGLLVGCAGGYLFSKSQRPDPGSIQDRLELAEQEAAKSGREARALKAYVERAEGSGSAKFRRISPPFGCRKCRFTGKGWVVWDDFTDGCGDRNRLGEHSATLANTRLVCTHSQQQQQGKGLRVFVAYLGYL